MCRMLRKTFEGVNTKFIISGLLGDFHFLLYNSLQSKILFNKLIFLSQSEKRFLKKKNWPTLTVISFYTHVEAFLFDSNGVGFLLPVPS